MKVLDRSSKWWTEPTRLNRCSCSYWRLNKCSSKLSVYFKMQMNQGEVYLKVFPQLIWLQFLALTDCTCLVSVSRTSYSCSTKASLSWRCLTKPKWTSICWFSSWIKSSMENKADGRNHVERKGSTGCAVLLLVVKIHQQETMKWCRTVLLLVTIV